MSMRAGDLSGVLEVRLPSLTLPKPGKESATFHFSTVLFALAQATTAGKFPFGRSKA